MKNFKIILLIGFLLLVATEIMLRCYLGFCDALLYSHSDAYEYIAQPNQRRYRFGAHICYNAYSQRNDTNPDSTKVRILGLGDSVIFGGTMLDQDSIATAIFNRETDMQMLNISAGSWGPDNCAAYLKEKGTFGANAMILVCSSHDAYDVMSHIPVVGIYPNYPNKQYKLAIWELVERYLFSYIKNFFRSVKSSDPDETVVKQVENSSIMPKSPLFNPGFDELKEIADSVKIPFYIYLHAEQGEVKEGGYNEMGQQIVAWASRNNVHCIMGISTGEKVGMYRDAIHFNEKGQRHLANVFIRVFSSSSMHYDK